MALNKQIGTFAWFNLMTKNKDTANSFYKDLFNWQFEDYEIPGVGTSTCYIAKDKYFGSPIPLEQNTPFPSHWIPYIAVADVDTCCQQIQQNSGKICFEPFDIPTIGRTAIVNDPVGGVFHIYTPENKNEDLKVTGHEAGQICWLEMMLKDPNQVIPFYEKVFGWRVQKPSDINNTQYFSFEINGEKLGGFLATPPGCEETHPAWTPYFTVDNAEDSEQRAQKLGGKVVMPKMHIPDTGFASLIQDPSGAHFYTFEADFN